jgi:heme/copper-type cytochrome/quinol oxidase subunit 2
MQKAQKLRYINWSLIVGMTITLATSIALEATDSSNVALIIAHIIVALISVVLGIIHIKLHFGNSNWFKKFSKLKNQAIRILWWLFLVLMLSALAATIHWLVTGFHSPIGGIHGKIGFLMMIFAIGHVVKRRKYFTR